MIDPTTTLGDLVTEDPRRARVLDELGVDYCCGGQRSLADAAAAAGLDAAEVAARLDLPDREPAPAWQSLGIGELAQHIVDVHHGYLWDEMRPLAALVDKVATVHGDRHPELTSVRADYSAIVADLESHLTKEERILFPAIVAVDGDGPRMFPAGAISGPITQMLHEHDLAGELLARIRETTGGFATPADGCASYALMNQRLAALEADLHEHIHKENNVLFPRTLEADAAV